MKIKYYTELDGVRGIAALMVMVFHFFLDLKTDNPAVMMIRKFAGFGQTGVSLFFVLSGFLITRILLESKEDPNYFRNFYVRRSLRIFPLYFLFLFIFFFILPWCQGLPAVPFKDQVYYWTYIQNFALTFKWSLAGPSHYWSLAVEEHFYLFWPFIVFFCNKRYLPVVISFLIVAALFVRWLLVKESLETFYLTFSRMDELALGALLGLLEVEKRIQKKHAAFFLVGLVLLIFPTVIFWGVYSGEAKGWIQIVKYNLISLIYFCFIGYAITIKDSNVIKRVLRGSFLQYTGKISYGLYVYHMACFGILHYLNIHNVAVNIIVGFVFTYLVATISFNFFETKFLRLKKYFNYDSKKLKPAIA